MSNSSKSVFPKSRLEAFSDGVIAIIVTILVLELKIPGGIEGVHQSEYLAEKLMEILPKVLSYFVSFLMLAVWWISHHQLFASIKWIDNSLLFLNSLFLMILALLPFPTALIGEYPQEKVPSILFGSVGILAGVCFILMRWHVDRFQNKFESSAEKEAHRLAFKKSLISPVLYLCSTLLVFLHPYVAYAGFAFIPMFYFYSRRSASK
jgi:uncharacterized membrane protein